MSDAVIEAIETIELTEAVASPTTKQTLQDLTVVQPVPARSTGEDLKQVIETEVVAKRNGLFADDYIAPQGHTLVLRNGQTVLVPNCAVKRTDKVINTKRIQLSPIGRLPDVHINLANRLFLRGQVQPDVFVGQLSAYLSHWVGGNKEISMEFLSFTAVVNRMGNGKFATKTEFAKTLRKEFIDFAREFYPSHVLEFIESDPLAALRNAQTKNEITEGYKRLISGDPFGPFCFYMGCYRMIRSKCAARVYDLREVSATPSDYAQKAVIRIWKSLPQFRGGPDGIYSWVNKASHNASLDCFSETKTYIDKHVEALTTERDEDGKERLQDNPLITEQHIYSEIHPNLPRELPEWIVGTDRLICMLIREGLNYKEIDREMGFDKGTTNMRVKRMRDKVSEMGYQEKRAEYLRDRDARWARAQSGRVGK